MPSNTDKTTYLVMPYDEARARLSGHIQAGKKLLTTPVANSAELKNAKAQYRKWRDYGTQLLSIMFNGASMAARLRSASVVMSPQSFGEEYQGYRDDFLDDITTLESIAGILPIMKRGRPKDPTKPSRRSAMTNEAQDLHGPLGKVIAANSGQAAQRQAQRVGADSKLWQLFLALLGIAGTIVAAYLAHWFHWV